MQRPDWRAEKKLNKETFGTTGNMGGGYRGRGRGGGGGYYNRNNNRGGGYRGGYGGPRKCRYWFAFNVIKLKIVLS